MPPVVAAWGQRGVQPYADAQTDYAGYVPSSVFAMEGFQETLLILIPAHVDIVLDQVPLRIASLHLVRHRYPFLGSQWMPRLFASWV